MTTSADASQLDAAKKKYKIAQFTEKTAEQAYKQMLSRLRKTEITHWVTNYDTDWFVQFVISAAGVNFDNPTADSYGKNHWVFGVSSKVGGFIDENWVNIDSTNVKYYRNIGGGYHRPVETKGAYFYSCNTNLTGRSAVNQGFWNALMSKASGGLYSDRDMLQPLPISYADQWPFSVDDDVTFTKKLFDYWQKCKKDTKAKEKIVNVQQAIFTGLGGVVKTDTVKDGSGGGGGGGKNGIVTGKPGTHLPPTPPPTSPLIYNLPGVKEMYFSNSAFQSEVLFVNAGNQPVFVTKADDLWKDTSKAYKGMIQTNTIYKPLGTSAPKTKAVVINDINKGPYAFQFLYNPNLVSMEYNGAPDVDPIYEATGQDKSNLVGSASSSSSISFNVLINRMNDFKYADAILAGNLAASDIYPLINRENVLEDVKQIQQMGTMYDVEHLLRTLLGYGLPSALRHRATADIGYLGAFPVELHLGKSLRYLGVVGSISLSHTIFTKDMVPVFTNLSIAFNRLPDYPPVKAKK